MGNFITSQIRLQIHNFEKSFLQLEKLPFNDFFPAKTDEAKRNRGFINSEYLDFTTLHRGYLLVPKLQLGNQKLAFRLL